MTGLELDAVRDALGLLRAVHEQDEDGITAVWNALACPECGHGTPAQRTALVLAEMLDAQLDDADLDALQKGASR